MVDLHAFLPFDRDALVFADRGFHVADFGAQNGFGGLGSVGGHLVGFLRLAVHQHHDIDRIVQIDGRGQIGGRLEDMPLVHLEGHFDGRQIGRVLEFPELDRLVRVIDGRGHRAASVLGRYGCERRRTSGRTVVFSVVVIRAGCQE